MMKPNFVFHHCIVLLCLLISGEATFSEEIMINPGQYVANAGPDRTTRVYEEVVFSAHASIYEPNANVIFEWFVGEGKIGEGIKITHVFLQPSLFEVKLTLSINDTIVSQSTATITVLGEGY